jgi:hypothetical protein
MTDDRTKTAQDRKRISLTEDYEVRYWTHELGITKDQLAAMVKEHGNSVDKIRAALAK